MFRALYTAASGMNAQQLNLDNVANNLANTSTAGFRRRRVQFTDLLYQNMVMPGSASTQQTTNAAGLQVGLGTKPGASEVLQLQGDFSQTGNPLDLAIQGTGIFSGANAGRRNGLHALRDFPSGFAGQHRDRRRKSAGAGDHSSARRSLGHHRCGRHGVGHAARPDSGNSGGEYSAGVVSQSRRFEQRRQQPDACDHCVRRSHRWYAGRHRGTRFAAARVSWNSRTSMWCRNSWR